MTSSSNRLQGHTEEEPLREKHHKKEEVRKKVSPEQHNEVGVT